MGARGASLDHTDESDIRQMVVNTFVVQRGDTARSAARLVLTTKDDCLLINGRRLVTVADWRHHLSVFTLGPSHRTHLLLQVILSGQ